MDTPLGMIHKTYLYTRKIGTILVGEEVSGIGIGSLELLQSEVEKGGLVNMYWIGRNEQASIRAILKL